MVLIIERTILDIVLEVGETPPSIGVAGRLDPEHVEGF
jgi:hypothetical protein